MLQTNNDHEDTKMVATANDNNDMDTVMESNVIERVFQDDIKVKGVRVSGAAISRTSLVRRPTRRTLRRSAVMMPQYVCPCFTLYRRNTRT